MQDAVGLSNQSRLGKKSYLKTILSLTGNVANWTNEVLDNTLIKYPFNKVQSNTWKYSLTSIINNKFSTRLSGRSGFIINRLHYRQYLQQSSLEYLPMETFVDQGGYSYLYQFFSQSKYSVNKDVIVTAGLHSQVFALNGDFSLEPRAL